MKSIKEKAKEIVRNTHPLFESIRESTGEPVSVYDQNDMIDMFESGANYVLECIENALNKSFDELSIKDGYLEARKCIEQLKK